MSPLMVRWHELGAKWSFLDDLYFLVSHRSVETYVIGRAGDLHSLQPYYEGAGSYYRYDTRFIDKGSILRWITNDLAETVEEMDRIYLLIKENRFGKPDWRAEGF